MPSLITKQIIKMMMKTQVNKLLSNEKELSAKTPERNFCKSNCFKSLQHVWSPDDLKEKN